MTQPCRLEYRGFHQLELVRRGGEEIRIGGGIFYLSHKKGTQPIGVSTMRNLALFFIILGVLVAGRNFAEAQGKFVDIPQKGDICMATKRSIFFKSPEILRNLRRELRVAQATGGVLEMKRVVEVAQKEGRAGWLEKGKWHLVLEAKFIDIEQGNGSGMLQFELSSPPGYFWLTYKVRHGENQTFVCKRGG